MSHIACEWATLCRTTFTRVLWATALVLSLIHIDRGRPVQPEVGERAQLDDFGQGPSVALPLRERAGETEDGHVRLDHLHAGRDVFE